MKNGQMWFDIDGNDIQAHGGCIIEFDGTYYWYGENKGADNVPGTRRVDVIGISCYSSKDLVNWKYEGLALTAEKDDINSFIHSSKVVERPKVIYNKKTKKFVMWMHIDSADYVFAGAGVAVSDTPVGPFKFITATPPNRQDCRDMTLFVDKDDIAYLVHSKDWNKTLNIARLTDDYLNVDGFYTSVLIDQEREAPALFIHNDMYYMITSGCTGWAPNSALYAQCKDLLGKWKLIDNPCEGENYRRTFEGQSSFVFTVDGKDYLMLDHWKPDELRNSGYSILPVTFSGESVLGGEFMTVKWQDEWNGIK